MMIRVIKRAEIMTTIGCEHSSAILLALMNERVLMQSVVSNEIGIEKIIIKSFIMLIFKCITYKNVDFKIVIDNSNSDVVDCFKFT